MANTRGRQVVLVLTNKSGGSVAAGDVVVFDTTTDESFTTTTTGRAELSVGIAQETIASNAVGRVLVAGYASLVNVPASVTRGHYLETHTVAKQATGSATRRSGSFGQFAKTSATPSAWLWGQTDQTASAAGGTGALVFLAAQTASASATLDFTSFISSTYDDYVFRLIGVVPATDLVDFYMRVSVAGVFDTGTNYVNNHYLQATSGNVSAVGTADTSFAVRRNAEITNAAARGLSGQIDLFNPQSTTLEKRIRGSISWSGATNYINTIMDGSWKTAGSAVDGVRFFFSAGNIASGTIRVYGVAKS